MFVELYVIFALTTALAGLYELVMPVVWVLKKSNPELNVVNYNWITYFSSIILIFIAAPIFFPLVIVPKMGVAFRHSLHKTFLNSQD